MSDQNNDNQKKININLPPDVADGTYANMALISHSPSEFILDFIRTVPGVPSPSVKSRIIMTPDNAKKLLRALQENMEKYESQFGTAGNGDTAYPFGFGGRGNA